MSLTMEPDRLEIVLFFSLEGQTVHRLSGWRHDFCASSRAPVSSTVHRQVSSHTCGHSFRRQDMEGIQLLPRF